jgi:hypothetical protein
MIAVKRVKASKMPRVGRTILSVCFDHAIQTDGQNCPSNRACYLRLRFALVLTEPFFAALAVFLAGFRPGLAAAFVADENRLPPEKMFSQLSEYCLVAPTRTTLIQHCSIFKNLFLPRISRMDADWNSISNIREIRG